MISGWLTACDAPDDASIEERDDVTMAAWPVVETERAFEPLDDLAARPRAAAGKSSPSEAMAIGWLRWAFAQPWSIGPVNDPTGASCAMGQQGSVWYLAGTSGGAVTRECTIPVGKKLVLPLVNSWWTFPEEFYPDEDAIAAGIPESIDWLQNNFAHTCALTLRLDGEDVIPGGFDDMLDELYIETFEPFEVELHPDDHYMSQYDVAGGPMLTTGAGYYARINPLPPGDHVLELGGVLCDGEDVLFETSATYHLHVGG
jgi:hypothetical protein